MQHFELHELALRLVTACRDQSLYPEPADAVDELHEEEGFTGPVVGWTAVLPQTTRDGSRYSHQVQFTSDRATPTHMKNLETPWADTPQDYSDPHWDAKLAATLRECGLEVQDDWNK